MAEGGMRLFTQPVVKQVRHTSQIVLFNTLSSLKKNVDCPSLSGKRISVSLKLEFDEKCLMFKLFFVSMNRGGIYSETSRSLDECGEPLCRNLFWSSSEGKLQRKIESQIHFIDSFVRRSQITWKAFMILEWRQRLQVVAVVLSGSLSAVFQWWHHCAGRDLLLTSGLGPRNVKTCSRLQDAKVETGQEKCVWSTALFILFLQISDVQAWLTPITVKVLVGGGG